MNTVFGPLNADSCVYFYAMSVFFGFLTLFIAVSAVLFGLTNFKKFTKEYLVHTFFALVNTTFAYFVYRLLNTMCVRSLS